MTELSSAVVCPECIEELRAAFPGRRVFSTAFIETEIHARHQPLHPNQVGSAHRRRARHEWERWESLSPYARPAEIRAERTDTNERGEADA